MSNWTAGYVADLGYTHGFYRELTPELLRFTALVNGMQAAPRTGPQSYCELGCGQGFSANLIASANPHIEVHATDFNPAQIAGARALAAEAGTGNVHFYDDAFADFGSNTALPDQFDMIGLHGIYSWVSAENRRHIVDFIRQRLRVGGLLYISYNTMPGWAALMPMRRILVDQAGQSAGPILPRIEGSISFFDQLLAVAPAYFSQNPAVAARFEKLKGMSRNYLAHEYFNRDWTPFYFADVAADLAEAKVSFLGSANLLDQIDAVNLTEPQQKFLAGAADPVRRQGLRDILINQQFRRDVFVKGAVSHSVSSSRAAWLEMRFVLSTRRADVPMTVNGALGTANLQPDVYGPLLDALAAGPRTVAQLVADERVADFGWAQLVQALAILVGAGHLQPALPIKDENKRKERTRAFNTAVCKRAQWSNELAFLASPVSGGGIAVDRFQQIFLLARGEKHADPAAFAWVVLEGQGQRLIRDGKPIEDAAENLAELRTRFVEFDASRVEVLQHLGIA